MEALFRSQCEALQMAWYHARAGHAFNELRSSLTLVLRVAGYAGPVLLASDGRVYQAVAVSALGHGEYKVVDIMR